MQKQKQHPLLIKVEARTQKYKSKGLKYLKSAIMRNKVSGTSSLAVIVESFCGRRPLQRRGHIKEIIAAKALHSILHILFKASLYSNNNPQLKRVKESKEEESIYSKMVTLGKNYT